MKSTCDLLIPAGIHHVCHNSGASPYCRWNPLGVSDLSAAPDICTECLVNDGIVGMKEILESTFLLDNNGLPCGGSYEELVRRLAYRRDQYNNILYLRGIGMMKKHILSKSSNGNDYAQCPLHRGSGPVREDRICWLCKLSVDE